MGGFSSNYEGGYLDFEETPKWMTQKDSTHDSDKKKRYKEKSSAENRYLNVLLSDESVLNAKEKASKDDLCQYCESDIYLEIKVCDMKVLKIYYEDSYIGRIEKIFEGIDNTDIVDGFCFAGNRLKDIEAFWDGQSFYLKEKKS
jgi:hypothetical protein